MMVVMLLRLVRGGGGGGEVVGDGGVVEAGERCTPIFVLLMFGVPEGEKTCIIETL